jgi:membrane protein
VDRVDNADATPGLGTFAGLVSLATLLFSVSGVFGELQGALNRMWEVKAAPGASGTWPWIRKRLLSLGTFASVAFLLVVSLAVNAFVTAASESARDVLPGSDAVWQAATFVLAPLLSVCYAASSAAVSGRRNASISSMRTCASR